MSIDTYVGTGNGVAHYQPQPHVQPRTVQRLTDWAESARAAHEVAESLVQTSFVPVQFRDKPHEATAAILAGDEVGLNPMASLRAFDIIQGSAAPRAMTQRAVVQSVGHEMWVHESTDQRAIVKGRRAGSSVVQESVWTLDRARGLKLLGKDNWQKQPGAMLVARASSECARLIASDALMGMPYSIEELTDGSLPDYEVAPQQEQTSARPARRTAQRRSQPRNAPKPEQASPPSQEPSGPPLPGEYDEQPEQFERPSVSDAEPSSELKVTKAQLTKLGAIFTEADISNRDTRLAIVAKLVDRPIASSNELTKTEASELIDNLEKLGPSSDLAEVVAELLADDGDTQAELEWEEEQARADAAAEDAS